MSQENVEIARAAVEAWNAGDMGCGCRELDHAAISYSWMRPPSRSRRLTEGGPTPTA
jgi:hypothetical protein